MPDDQHVNDCGGDHEGLCHKVNIVTAVTDIETETIVVSVGPLKLRDAAELMGSEDFAETVRHALAHAKEPIADLERQAKARLN